MYPGHELHDTRGTSLPSRERGLKYVQILDTDGLVFVAPLAGAWIEIRAKKKLSIEEVGRSPRGSVD